MRVSVSTYQARRRAEPVPAEKAPQAPAGPSLAQLQAGAMPSQEQLGRRVDLPEGIRAKMEASFGADFSSVKLYESQTVADAGAQAVAMGSSIGFAPGALDLSSTAGQALLGHELSHVVSQARGEASGRGFLQDAGLEARADREGAMAAAGESVYTGPVTPVSTTSTTLSAAGPMQARKPRKNKDPIQKYSGKKALDKQPKAFEAYHQAQLKGSEAWQSKLSPAEKDAVETYSTAAFEQINGRLRGQNVTPPHGMDLEQATENVSSAIHKSRLESDTILHRGAGDGFIRFLLKNQMGIGKEALHSLGIQKDSIDDLTPEELRKVMMANATQEAAKEQVFSDPAFTSTSINRGVAADFATNHGQTGGHGHLMEIHAPKGTPAAYIEQLSMYQHENEMLLDKGQKWRLRAVQSIAGEKIPSITPGQNTGRKFDENSMRLILELINEEEEGQRR